MDKSFFEGGGGGGAGAGGNGGILNGFIHLFCAGRSTACEV